MEGRCRVRAATLRGVEAVPVDVEVAVGPGVPGFSIVGMADASVQESRERVRRRSDHAASRASRKVVVNLAPGALRKTGSGFDLPIAAGILWRRGRWIRVVQGPFSWGSFRSKARCVRPRGFWPTPCARAVGCAW